MPSDDPRSDLGLIAAANAGDAGAFDALYRRYRDRVARLAARLAGDDADAADVTQDAFLYLLGKFPGFELRASLMTFLYPAVRNLAIAARKKRLAGGDPEPALSAAPAASAAAPDDPLRDVVASLPESHREVLLLRVVDGLSLDEIAAAMNLPLGTVKSRLHHAVAKLRVDPKVRRYFDRE